MAKQPMLLDYPQHGFQSVSLRLQIKSLYSQSLLLDELKFSVKKIIFHDYKILYPGLLHIEKVY